MAKTKRNWVLNKFSILLLGALLLTGCSEYTDKENDLQPEEIIDERGYYY